MFRDFIAQCFNLLIACFDIIGKVVCLLDELLTAFAFLVEFAGELHHSLLLEGLSFHVDN